MTPDTSEDLLRELAPQVLAALVRRFGHFDEAEDAVQEALLAAATQWPSEGRPVNPRGWLTTAYCRMTDRLRSEQSRERREVTAAATGPADRFWAPSPEEVQPVAADDTLTLLLLCCHACLTAASQIALTLRAVGGLTTAEISRAFLVPEATMVRRISRAKAQIKASGATFCLPPPAPSSAPGSAPSSTCSTSSSTKATPPRRARRRSGATSPPRPSDSPGCSTRRAPTMARSPGSSP